MAHLVTCRWCGIKFDTDSLDKDKWVSPAKNWYYHSDCYEEKQKPGAIRPVKTDSDDFDTWRQNIFDLIQRDLKGSCNFARITEMMISYKKQYKHWTYKGMYYALRWFYLIKNEDWKKSNGAIGILPYIYEKGTEYWRERERKDSGIVKRIEEQINQMRNRPVIEIERKEKEN